MINDLLRVFLRFLIILISVFLWFFKYPEAILKFEYDPKLAIRGLHYDILRGLLLKIDSFVQVTTIKADNLFHQNI
jgi:hypothetical protein